MFKSNSTEREDRELAMASQAAANEEEDNEEIQGDLSRFKKARDTSAFPCSAPAWKTAGSKDMGDESVRLVTEQPT